MIIKGQPAYVSSTRRRTTGEKKKKNVSIVEAEFLGCAPGEVWHFGASRCSACMNNECTGGGGVERGGQGRRHPPNNRKVMLVCAVSFNRCETLLTETSKFRLKCSPLQKKKKKKLADGSITVKVNRRTTVDDNKSALEKARSNSFSCDAGNAVAFIADKEEELYALSAWFCFSAVWRLFRWKLQIVLETQRKSGKLQVDFSL